MRKTILIKAGFVIFLLNYTLMRGQVDSAQFKKEYTRLEDALKEPEKVYRLNLGNQLFKDMQIHLALFKNLEYLSFQNDHLTYLPKEISALQNLRILDLSGNNFKILPPEIAELKNLEELYLNDDKKLKLDKNFEILGNLPKLKSLHLEHDGFRKLPHNINKLKNLENLYINDNKLHNVPLEIKDLKKLRYVDLNHNHFSPKKTDDFRNFGIKIKF